MNKLALTALAVLLLPLHIFGSEVTVIEKIDNVQLAKLALEENFTVSEVKEDHLQLILDDAKCFLLIHENGNNFKFFSGFRNSPTAWEKINAFNRDFRFGRAYLDTEGDPCLEIDLDLTGGVTSDRIKTFLKTCRIVFLVWRHKVVN